ncbi:hypothetical protein GCM10017668_23660 [Streptomyces tuirus]|uniref:Uncharacterized protein n=1 Tax=Streptomyces tuirus TaxID=68278 RepID=A0A7G1NBL7_9ACTN|nr:hypothetical protein GCM10017668_23660 [Streptomyces tuirus]
MSYRGGPAGVTRLQYSTRRRVYGHTWEEARKKLTELLSKSDPGIPAADATESQDSNLWPSA